MTPTPDVTVAAIAETAGRFLLVEERINHRLVFNQPAGHVERGETLLAALVREVREESAWRFHAQALLGAYRWHNPETSHTVLRFAFIGSVSDHHATQRLDHGIVSTHWLTCSDLEQRRSQLRSPLVLRCVYDYLAGQRHALGSVVQLDLHSARDLARRAAATRGTAPAKADGITPVAV
jgi:ADP-ribose pyrophosphatase YjhB (NUDIX family)